MSTQHLGAGRIARFVSERAPEIALLALLCMGAGMLDLPYRWTLFLTGGAALLIAIVGGFRFRSMRGLQAARLERARSRSKELDRKLERRQEALDALTEGLDQIVFVCDPDTQVRYANRAARSFFRFDDPAGKQILGVTLSNEIDRLVRSCIDAGVRQREEIKISHPRERTMLVQAWPQREERDRFILSLNDLTELRHLETVRRDFVANVSHELRTPMTSVRTMAETLLDDGDDPALNRRYLEKIIHEMDRLTQISEDLLTLSVAESGKGIRERIDLSRIALAAVDQFRPRAAEKGLEIEFHSEGETLVTGHESSLEQVCINLIANAVNYTQEGSIEVTIRASDRIAELSVKDTGIGIAQEHQARIFERFYRVDKGRSRASGGTGLGLSIVRHIVETHGGSVHVESALNQGSTLTITLPLADAKED